MKHIFFIQGLNARLALAIAAGAIGSGFQHGWATGVVNCPQWFVMTWIRGCNASWDDTASDALNTSATTSAGTVTDTNGNGIKEECIMNKTQVTAVWALVVSIFCVGGMIGGSSVGILSSKLGR